jgi:hypothetical protein
MTDHFKIASLLSACGVSPARNEQILQIWKQSCNSLEQQEAFFNYCSRYKLAPWIYVQLGRMKMDELLHESVKEKFSASWSKIKLANEKRNKEATRFLSEFVKQNIDVAVLKGNLFAQTVYKDSGYKRMNDFDILIRREDWEKAQSVYISLGYIPLGFGWSGEKQKAAKYSHVGMSFISPDYSCIVGTQWGLKSPTTSYTVDMDEAWRTALPFDFCGVPVKQLSPEYNLLHLILHMGIYKCGIRDCMDVYNLIHACNIDPEKFRTLLLKSGALEKAHFTLRLSGLCVEIPSALLDAVAFKGSGFISRRLKRRLEVHRETGDFQDSYNDYFQDIEKVVIYFNIFPAFHKKLRCWLMIMKLIFFPDSDIASKLNDTPTARSVREKISARVKAPYFVFSLISQEIGWKFTILLFIKLFTDLIVSLKNYIFKTQSYFDYLRQRGIDPESIKKAVKDIQ